MSPSTILRYSSATLEITSLSWQTLELLMILHKHSVPWESGLSNASMTRHLDLATGTADKEMNEGAEESAAKLDLQEVRGLMEQEEVCLSCQLLISNTLSNIIYNVCHPVN